jgi:hypothetical protein
MNNQPPPKKHHRLFYLFVVLVMFGLWKLLHRDDSHPWPLPAEAWPGEAPEVAGPEPGVSSHAPGVAGQTEPADPLTDLARVLAHRAESTDGSALTNGAGSSNGAETDAASPPAEATAFEHRYAVKWTDRSQGEGVSHEKRDLTLREAMSNAGWIAQHARRFYSGADSARSPFAELRVYLQCLCGRDVPDLTKPHTIPGGERVCQYSGQAPADASSVSARH